MKTLTMHAAILCAALVGLAACSAGSNNRYAAPRDYARYWNVTLDKLAHVVVAVNYTTMALSDGDRERATQLLAYARKYADSANDATGSTMPSAWDNAVVGARLKRAGALLSDAVTALQGGESSSAIDQAQSERQRAILDVLAAAAAAPRSYARLGGRSSDLESLQSATQHTLASLDSMMGHGSDDDSST
jgi:hypothetical protein